MGFYDNYNFEGLRFFSKLKDPTHETIAVPCKEMLTIIKELKTITSPTESLKVAEIGIGFGATTLQVLQLLDENDTYYAFDIEHIIKSFEQDLQAGNLGVKCQVVTKANSSEAWDSYNWNLSNMIFEMRKRKEAGIFNVVYLDGAHALVHDGLAVCLLKELIKEGGYLVLDNLFWTFAKSAWGRGFAPGKLTKEQMEDKQIFRVQELFLTPDTNWERLSSLKEPRGVFRKRSRGEEILSYCFSEAYETKIIITPKREAENK